MACCGDARSPRQTLAPNAPAGDRRGRTATTLLRRPAAGHRRSEPAAATLVCGRGGDSGLRQPILGPQPPNTFGRYKGTGRVRTGGSTIFVRGCGLRTLGNFMRHTPKWIHWYGYIRFGAQSQGQGLASGWHIGALCTVLAPASVISSTTAISASSPRAPKTTSTPRSASSLAVARRMPLLAPNAHFAHCPDRLVARPVFRTVRHAVRLQQGPTREVCRGYRDRIVRRTARFLRAARAKRISPCAESSPHYYRISVAVLFRVTTCCIQPLEGLGHTFCGRSDRRVPAREVGLSACAW